jgi:hypothetical protein
MGNEVKGKRGERKIDTIVCSFLCFWVVVSSSL